jgi:hypothetical protein
MARLLPRPIHARSPALARCRHGISTTELVVTMGLLMLLIGITTTSLMAARRSRSQVQCAANLHAIGLAFTYYAHDYQDSFPVPTPDAQWEDLLRPYVPRNIFRCSADNELFAALSSSYDWRDTGDPRTSLAGKLAMQVTHANAALAFDALPGWHSQGTLQVLHVDSRVDMMAQEAFFRDLRRPPTEP